MRLFKILSCFIFCASLITSPLQANDSTPMNTIKNTIDHILNTLKNDSIDKLEKRNIIMATINQSFDFKDMAQRTLATNWRKTSPQQRQDFIQLFGRLIQNTYMGRLEAYTNEEIRYLKSKIKGRKAIVKTLIITKSTDIPIKYKLSNKSGGWLVYDVEVEKISMISNYRSTYQNIIKRKGFAKLLIDMRAKVDELNKSLYDN